MMTVFPAGDLGMGKQLAAWFVYCVVIGIFAAYLTSRALPSGAPYLEVFRFAATVAFVAYGMGLWQHSIWYRRKWATTIRSNIDALIYGLLTGGDVRLVVAVVGQTQVTSHKSQVTRAQVTNAQSRKPNSALLTVLRRRR